jgi:hypothetical protein
VETGRCEALLCNRVIGYPIRLQHDDIVPVLYSLVRLERGKPGPEKRLLTGKALISIFSLFSSTLAVYLSYQHPLLSTSFLAANRIFHSMTVVIISMHILVYRVMIGVLSI